MKHVSMALNSLAMLATSSSAWGYTIGLINVGEVDPLIE
jgi:hypothetical protein